MVELLIVVGAVLISSGFFSCSEASLLSINEAEVESMIQQNATGSAMLAIVQKQIDRAVIAIVIMNNVVNIVGSILVGQIVNSVYGDAMLAITTTALTFSVIIFSEIIPKAVGIHYATTIARFISLPIWILTKVLLPIIVILEWITNMLKKGERKVGTEDQIRSLVNLGRQSGHIESDEGQLIHRAFILNDKTAKDIMTDLKDVIGFSADKTASEAWEKIQNDPHSRYPLFGDSIHDIQGIVLRADILQKLAENEYEFPVKELMRESLVVDASMNADSLIVLFRDKSIHLAVVQEDDHTIGLVTLEDVLEELVGNIEDETDVDE